jgi:hypothetical protein
MQVTKTVYIITYLFLSASPLNAFVNMHIGCLACLTSDAGGIL